MNLVMAVALLAPPALTTPPVDVAEGGTTQVLFLGNSYTGFFDLSEQFRNLSNSGGKSASTGIFAGAGYTFGAPQTNNDVSHSENPGSLGLIASANWDYVVLQEQSCIPALPNIKAQYMLPGAAILDGLIKANDPSTKTLLFQTWGRENGGVCCWDVECSQNFPNFAAMQDALTASYDELACWLGAEVAPAGEAWRRALQSNPPTTLFDPDGSHPAYAGTYLNACVFYAVIYGESPVGLSFKGALTGVQAAFFQQVAHDTVFGPNAYALNCTGPTTYCTAKASSAACVAYIGSTDIMADPQSGGLDYALTATNVQGLKNGLVFASLSGAAAFPFNGGVFCVQPPTRRGPIMSSFGTLNTCDGSYSQIVNDGLMIPFGLDAGPGNTAWYQWWYRDPQNGPGQLGTALSNAIAVDFL